MRTLLLIVLALLLPLAGLPMDLEAAGLDCAGSESKSTCCCDEPREASCCEADGPAVTLAAGCACGVHGPSKALASWQLPPVLPLLATKHAPVPLVRPVHDQNDCVQASAGSSPELPPPRA